LTGTGTLADPYVIWDIDDLQDMELDLTAHYELGQDIDAAKPAWTWEPQIRRPTADLAGGGVWTVFPAAPGTRFDKVNEAVEDGDATYIRTAVNNSWCLFNFNNFNVPGIAEHIYLEITAYARNNGSGSSRFQARIRVNGNNYNSGTNITVYSPNYVKRIAVFTINPDTGLPWTVADINGVGPNPLQGFGTIVTDASPEVRITQVYATALSSGFNPVGQDPPPHVPATRFSGYFDGKGHTIRNLYIYRPTDEYCVGLFGITRIFDWAGYIRNVTLENVDITGNCNTGTLIGFHEWQVPIEGDGMISNCSVTGVVKGQCFLVGGLAGFNGGLIEDCWADVDVIMEQWEYSDIEECGSFVGLDDGIIRSCHSLGDITCQPDGSPLVDVKEIGGFVGYNNNHDIYDCYSTGNVSINPRGLIFRNSWAFGSFIGDNWGNGAWRCYSTGNIDIILGTGGQEDFGAFIGFSESPVTNCYSRGNLTLVAGPGTAHVGGFVGYNRDTMTNCYSTGRADAPGATQVGGLVGYNNVAGGGVVTNCFWDIQTSGQTTSDGGEGKTTEEMNHRDIYVTAGWDLDTIWNISQVSTGLGTNITPGTAVLNGLLDLTIINEAYPFLRWQTVVENPCDCGFEWGETLDLGNFTPVASKNTGDSFGQALSGLKPQTKYYFRSRAHSSPGPIHGGIGTFTTAIGIEVETLPATNITEHSARIWGVVRKVPVTAMGRFDWGGSIDYGQETAWQPGLVSDDMFFVDLDNLAEGRAYHFRAVAMGNTIVYGNDMTFTTLSPLGPVTFIQEELHHILEVA
jgi:hypothetical protein